MSESGMSFAQVVAELKDLKTYSMHVEPYNETYLKIKLYGFGDKPEGINATPTWNIQAVGAEPEETFQRALVAAAEAKDGVTLRAFQRAGQGNFDLEESEPRPKGLARSRAPAKSAGPKLSSGDLAKLMGL